jgi:flagellar biosynthesis protein FlhG
LVDGDAGLANADLLLGLVPEWTWDDVQRGRASAEEAITSGPSGLELLVSGPGEATIHSLVDAVAGRATGPSALPLRRHTILDLGAGIGRGVVDLATACDLIWLVMTPEPTSLADAYAMARQIWRVEPDARIELVVNRCADRREAESAARSLQRLTRRFLGQSPSIRTFLPEDPAMGRAVSRQEPVLLGEPRSPVARSLRHLAETWMEEAGGAATSASTSPIGGFGAALSV